MILSVTKLELKNFGKLFRFFLRTYPAYFQAKRSPGNLFSEMRVLGLLTFGTLTAWESEEALLKYRNSGRHLEAMKASRGLTVLLQSTHFEAPESLLKAKSKARWDEAFQGMEADLKSVKYDIRSVE